MKPAVSVIIPSYNHARYLEECLESVLNQTFQDFEIIVTDDGSADHSVQILKSYSDPRLKLFLHQKNRGACVASNNCVRNSAGRYIAMLSSDDVWLPEKLALQVQYLDEHPEIGAVFGKVIWIDDQSREITTSDFPYQFVFEVENKSRFEWLRYFFKYGNCLCHPCSLVRRECYDEVGLLNPALANLPDLDLWVRLCFRREIHIMDEKLIRFRRIGEQVNASGDSLRNRIRGTFEYKQLLDHYLQIRDVATLLKIFPEADRYGEPEEDLLPYYLGRLALEEKVDIKMLWGLELIFNLLQNESLAERLRRKLGFTPLDFIRLAGSANAFNLLPVEPIPTIVDRIGVKRNLEELHNQVMHLEQQLEGIANSPTWKMLQSTKNVLIRLKLLPVLKKILKH